MLWIITIFLIKFLYFQLHQTIFMQLLNIPVLLESKRALSQRNAQLQGAAVLNSCILDTINTLIVFLLEIVKYLNL